MHKPLNNRTYTGKKCFFYFLGADFVAPKSGHRCEKQPVYIRAGLGIPTKNTRSKNVYTIQPPDLLFLVVLYMKRITRSFIMLNTMMENENTSFANISIPFLLFSFSIIVFNMMKLLVIFFIMKLIAQINIFKFVLDSFYISRYRFPQVFRTPFNI